MTLHGVCESKNRFNKERVYQSIPNGASGLWRLAAVLGKYRPLRLGPKHGIVLRIGYGLKIYQCRSRRKEQGERNKTDSKQDNKDNDNTVPELDAVQLLGRTWRITEDPIKGLPPIDPVAVNAPTTGAVGHLPVLQRGQLFEYMSGYELVTPSGAMQGLLHFAAVDSSTTESAVVG